MADLLVWWLSQWDCKHITDGEADGLPAYLYDQFIQRRGRPGWGRLWVSDEFSEEEKVAARIDPWPETATGRYLTEFAGGIVFRRADLPALADLPGIVTDLQLRRA